MILKNGARILYIGVILISVFIVTVQSYLNHDYSNLASYIKISITLVILFVIAEYLYTKKLSKLPKNLFYIAAIFNFAANFLGELNNFYEKFPWWDSALHLISGVLIGLTMILIIDYVCHKIFNIKSEGEIKNYLTFLLIISILSSISLAVFWEFYELSADLITGSNMQDGLILSTSTSYNEIAPYVLDSNRVMDKALLDTMEDQFLAVLGSFIAAGITLFYIKTKKILYFPLINKYNKLQRYIKKDKEHDCKKK